jgi:hypothetical protein
MHSVPATMALHSSTRQAPVLATGSMFSCTAVTCKDGTQRRVLYTKPCNEWHMKCSAALRYPSELCTKFRIWLHPTRSRWPTSRNLHVAHGVLLRPVHDPVKVPALVPRVQLRPRQRIPGDHVQREEANVCIALDVLSQDLYAVICRTSCQWNMFNVGRSEDTRRMGWDGMGWANLCAHAERLARPQTRRPVARSTPCR